MSQKLKEELNRVKEIMFPNESITEGNHESSYMAKSQLYNIANKSQSMFDRLEKGEELADWMESKIAQMSDNLDSVVNSFEYDEHKNHEDSDEYGKKRDAMLYRKSTEIEDRLDKIEGIDDEVVTLDLEEDTMSGMQGGYADTSDSEPGYDFESEGPLGSEPELGDEGFTEPETNYSKEQKGYTFDSDGPEDSYVDSSDEYNMELGYELGEQEGSSESGESSDGAGAGTAAVGVWDSGIARGIANQVANSKWSDSYQPSRGKGNPVW